jgi:ubiquinone/menaquinone biosynthesis C-methylase UbiE
MRENLHVAMSAQEYHDYISTATGPWDELLLSRFSQVYKPSPDGRIVVDIGTGTAVLLIRLAQKPEYSDATFIGTDLFSDMIVTAREAVDISGLSDRIRLEEGDVHHMPYSSEYADYVLSRSNIHHWAEPVQAFREIFRILRPGGIAMLHEPRRDPNPQFLEDFNRRRRAAGFKSNDLSEKYTVKEVEGFLEAAGIGDHSKIFAPEDGPASMGFEVYIGKSAA